MKKFNKTVVHNALVNLEAELLQLVTDKKCNKTTIKSLFSDYLNEFEPKSGGGQVKNPMIEKNGINYHYCRYLDAYYPEDKMVMSSGKCKGYHKKAIALWTKAGKDAKALEHEALKLLLDGKQEDGSIKNSEAQELLLNRNKKEFYVDLKLELSDEELIID